MIASELKIGNLVKGRWNNYGDHGEIIPKKEILTVDGISPEYPESSYIKILHREVSFQVPPFTLKEENVFAIPLTEEWLQKFGFSDATGDGYGGFLSPYYGENADKKIRVKKALREKEYYSHSLSGFDEVIIKYVHQLQNLYFALTGEELLIV